MARGSCFIIRIVSYGMVTIIARVIVILFGFYSFFFYISVIGYNHLRLHT